MRRLKPVKIYEKNHMSSAISAQKNTQFSDTDVLLLLLSTSSFADKQVKDLDLDRVDTPTYAHDLVTSTLRTIGIPM